MPRAILDQPRCGMEWKEKTSSWCSFRVVWKEGTEACFHFSAAQNNKPRTEPAERTKMPPTTRVPLSGAESNFSSLACWSIIIAEASATPTKTLLAIVLVAHISAQCNWLVCSFFFFFSVSFVREQKVSAENSVSLCQFSFLSE